MKIESLRISNFRGIADVSMRDLGNIVIIAGQNGSGKSCVFDAIRLVKSVYGGYQANEWQQWMGEFQINLTNSAADFTSIFNNPQRDVIIDCEFKMASEERAFIANNARDLLREKIWKVILPEAYSWGRTASMFATQVRDREAEVANRVEQEYAMLMSELQGPTISAAFCIRPGMPPEIRNSIALSIVFSTFRPRQIGVVDFHGAQRHYGRESVQGINLNLDANEQQRSQTALYNYAAKYNNVKSEMAASYVKEILAERAGFDDARQSTLTETLQELFQTFFPEKVFLGPQPTKAGSLTFPVRIGENSAHDLDELSAGEKEILYGYLRIRNSAPRYSIILLDEPELHLNPRLIRGLPEFYRKNLGESLENQIWLVTHSDALLREVVGREAYNVYHMLPCASVTPGDNQLKALSVKEDLDLALIDMVGDLAAYHPGAKVIILEGGGDSDFDKRVVSTLFPEIGRQANLISGTNKQRVKALLDILEKAAVEGDVPLKFFCITDSDGESLSTERTNQFSWDVYHIENYFLDPDYILRVVKELEPGRALTRDDVHNALWGAAKDTLPVLLRRDLSAHTNVALVRSINTEFDPAAPDLADAAAAAVVRSMDKLSKASLGLNADLLRVFAEERNSYYQNGLSGESWMKIFPGRDVLRRLVQKLNITVSYEALRNLILAKMSQDGHRPSGMVKVLSKVIDVAS
ncbi:AAA family ATPase [Dyella kyungheensis]|uniref:AAA family ATPase n=1 Tax=Dyella kyungheensis TaxID=1242174 RepID=A0ABS2JR42_9GAMM|nr:AAA family ATPase [Dyella kyungheensis]MBM7121496.1 AAA family ATPase [Dyella kyungheensis]